MIILWCNDPRGIGCSWSGYEEELVAIEGSSDCSFTHCPNCGGRGFEEDEDEVEPEPEHDGYDVGGEG